LLSKSIISDSLMFSFCLFPRLVELTELLLYLEPILSFSISSISFGIFLGQSFDSLHFCNIHMNVSSSQCEILLSISGVHSPAILSTSITLNLFVSLPSYRCDRLLAHLNQSHLS